MVVTVVKADNNEDDRTKTTMNRKKKKENVKMKPQKRAEPTKEFLQFWEAYPRKVGKLAAFKAFEKVDPDAELLKKMIETIELWKKSKPPASWRWVFLRKNWRPLIPSCTPAS